MTTPWLPSYRPTKSTVDELQIILSGNTPEGWVELQNGDMVEQVTMTNLRAHTGAYMDNVAAGRRLAVTRKGKILGVLVPDVKVPAKAASIEELEALLAAESNSSTPT